MSLRYKPEHGLSGVSQEMPLWSALAQTEMLMWMYPVSKALAVLIVFSPRILEAAATLV